MMRSSPRSMGSVSVRGHPEATDLLLRGRLAPSRSLSVPRALRGLATQRSLTPKALRLKKVAQEVGCDD